jgi:hypothetical protein
MNTPQINSITIIKASIIIIKLPFLSKIPNRANWISLSSYNSYENSWK